MRSRQALIAAALVVATGLGIALLFRQSPPADADPARSAAGVQHRVEDGPLLMEVRSASPPASPPEQIVPPSKPSEPSPRISGLPLFEGGNAAVPRIAQRYPPAAKNPPAPLAAEVRHRVKDGDTLASLAERYLGNADRAPALFEANRDVLSDPDLLPIGAVLKIPSR